MKLHFTRGRRYRFGVAASAAVLILAALLLPWPVVATQPQHRTIHVDARTFAYDPGSITVSRGDTVTLTLEALDAVHGLYIDGYGLNLVAEPGHSATVTFQAERAGKFKFRCSVTCGTLHPFMLGELQVEPNTPLAQALVITFISAMAALLFFWK